MMSTKTMNLPSLKLSLGLAVVSAGTILAVVAGCSKESEAATSREQAPVAALQAHVDGNNFKIDATSAGCKAGAECTITMRLEATGEYHINDNYPYKFKANDAAGVEFLGKDGAGKNVFSKTAGDFVKEGEKVGVMTVHFKPAAKGTVTVAGVYKLSICSNANCLLEQANVSVPVEVK
jgi:hypothetical protein